MNRTSSAPVPVPGKSGNATNVAFSQGAMPQRARRYVFFVILLGLPLIAYCAYQVVTQLDTHTWLYLAGLTALTSCLATKIRLANGKRGSITLTAGDFTIFAALLLFGPEVAVLIGALEGFVSSVRVRIRRLYKYLFNMSQVSLVAFLVGKVYQECLGRGFFLDSTQGPPVIGLLLTLLFCAILFFMINSTLVTVALSLVTAQPMATLWRQNLLWISPSTFTSASAAAVIFLSTQSIGLFLALAIVPLVVGTYYAHQIQLSRQGVEQESFSGSYLLRMTQLRFFEDQLPNQAQGYIVTVILGAFPLLLYSVVRTGQEGNQSQRFKNTPG